MCFRGVAGDGHRHRQPKTMPVWKIEAAKFRLNTMPKWIELVAKREMRTIQRIFRRYARAIEYNVRTRTTLKRMLYLVNSIRCENEYNFKMLSWKLNWFTGNDCDAKWSKEFLLFELNFRYCAIIQYGFLTIDRNCSLKILARIDMYRRNCIQF